MHICFSSSCWHWACALILGLCSEKLLVSVFKIRVRRFLGLYNSLCPKQNHGDTEIVISCCSAAQSDFRQRWPSQPELDFVSHIDSYNVALYWRAIGNPLSSCPSAKFTHHNENELQTWKKRGWLCRTTISVLVSYCPLISFFPSGFAFRFFGGCGRAAASHQLLQEQSSLAHMSCTAAVYRAPCFFAWLPTM